MSFLLDTCVLSELTRKRPDRRVARWVGSQDEEALHLSVMSLGELHKGIGKLDDRERARLLSDWVDREVLARFGRRLLPIDSAVAAAWGRQVGESERTGTPLPVIDSLITATAHVHGLTVVTRNVSDFERCGARVLNPWEPV